MTHSPVDAAVVASTLGLLVHDIRNPLSTLATNADYLLDVEAIDDDAREAIADMKIAVDDLARGLEKVSWIASFLRGTAAFRDAPFDVAVALAGLSGGDVHVTSVGPGPFVARGGACAVELVEVLVANAREHARGEIRISVRREPTRVVVDVVDAGKAIGADKRERAFTLEGQDALKGVADGRYARFLGLAAVRAAIASIGGDARASGEDGAARFELSFAVA